MIKMQSERPLLVDGQARTEFETTEQHAKELEAAGLALRVPVDGPADAASPVDGPEEGADGVAGDDGGPPPITPRRERKVKP